MRATKLNMQDSSLLSGFYDRRRGGMVNGRAVFVKRGNPDVLLWCNDNQTDSCISAFGWSVGSGCNLGRGGVLCALDSSLCPEHMARDSDTEVIWQVNGADGELAEVPGVRCKAIFDSTQPAASGHKRPRAPVEDEAFSDATEGFVGGLDRLQTLSVAQLIELQQKLATAQTAVASRLEKELSEQEQYKCSVCLDAPKEEAFVPCGHTFCAMCAAQLPTCAICKQSPTSRMRIYL